MYLPREAGDGDQIRRLQDQVRRLRTRTGDIPPVTELTAKLYSDTNGLFEDFTESRLGYYVDRSRCYMGGEVGWVAASSGGFGQFLFDSSSDAMADAATPYQGAARITIPYDWENSSTGTVYTGGSPAPYAVNLTGAWVEAVVHGDVVPGSVYIAFQRSIIPNPVDPASIDEPTSLYQEGVVDGGLLNFDQVSWRTA